MINPLKLFGNQTYIIPTMTDKEIMIEHHLLGRNIYDSKVLQAMHDTPREHFVPANMKKMAYDDSALPIGNGQTISQPYIVAYMAQVLQLQPTDVVLEIGAGSGYNAAVMSQLVSHVYSVEIIESLAEQASKNIHRAHIGNISIKWGDGSRGWPEAAPFDKIVITAATTHIPDSLTRQLKTGGKIIAPVKEKKQKLILLEKNTDDEFFKTELLDVRFVLLRGELEK
jgi:protein-L-isoaspartate(D-aspartate) O-methyltransferase